MAAPKGDSQDGEKITAMIVSKGTAATPRQAMPRRSWRRVAGATSVMMEDACRGLLRFEGPARLTSANRNAVKVRVNFWHPLALPFCCICFAAVPFLGLWAVIGQLLTWHGARQTRRQDAKLLRSR